MPFLKIEGKRIYFKGEAGRPGMWPVILIHGAGGSSNIWLRQIQALEENFQVLAIDLPGHGYSEGNGEETIEDYVRFVSAWLEALDLRQVFLVGHSMGGAIAMSLALSFPEKIRKMALAGSGARLRVPPEVFAALNKDFKEAIRVICRYAYSSHFPTYLLSLVEAEMGKARPEVFLKDLVACDAFDMRSQLSQIQVPSLILCGREDRFTPLELSLFLRDNLPNSRLEVIEGAGHMAMIESTSDFNEVLARFLSEAIST
jgi:pimeloyl-ACP methyl ester carboxylesterase